MAHYLHNIIGVSKYSEGNILRPYHRLRIVLLAAGSVLATTAVSNAVPIRTLYNTGVDASGLPRDNNASELHYRLASVPSGTTNVRVETSANGFPDPYWLGDNGTSAWIGPDSNLSLHGPDGDYAYHTSFDLSGLDPSTAFITGQWSADNAGTDILINSISTGSTAAGFGSFYKFTISSGFISGVNTLDFMVNNYPNNGQDNPTGLRVEMGGKADVPEPISLAILSSGLLALGMLRRRRG